MPRRHASLARSGVFAAAGALASWALGACRGSVRPPDYEVARVVSPTPAVMAVVATRRAMMPWAQVLSLRAREQDVGTRCPGDAPLPRGPFAGALAEDATGARLAFRCGPTAPWGIVYTTPTDAWLRCAPPLHVPSVDWSQVPTFVAEAPQLATCPGAPFDRLAAEVRRQGGEAAVADLLEATVRGGGDTLQWVEALRAAQEPTRLRVRARGEAVLSTTEPTFEFDVDRAARVARVGEMPLDDDRVEALLRFCAPGPGRAGCDRLLRRLIARAPRRASQLACDAVVRRDLAAVELAAIASDDEPCEALRAQLTRTQCAAIREDAAQCGDDARPRPCAREDFQAALAAELGPDGVPPGSYGEFARHRARVLAAAALRQGVACPGPGGP